MRYLSRKILALVLLVNTLNIVDALLTRYCVALGAVDLNPLAHTQYFILIKLLVGIVWSAVVIYFRKIVMSNKYLLYSLTLLVMIYESAIINNMLAISLRINLVVIYIALLSALIYTCFKALKKEKELEFNAQIRHSTNQ